MLLKDNRKNSSVNKIKIFIKNNLFYLGNNNIKIKICYIFS